MEYTEHYAQFFTATILEWKHLLQPDKYKDIITGSLQYLVTNKRVKVFAFFSRCWYIHKVVFLSRMPLLVFSPTAEGQEIKRASIKSIH